MAGSRLGLFDFGRLPFVTMLAAVGLGVCLWQWRREQFRAPVAIFILFLLIYFGRPTWGPILGLLPMGQDLHLDRFIAGVHLDDDLVSPGGQTLGNGDVGVVLVGAGPRSEGAVSMGV